MQKKYRFWVFLFVSILATIGAFFPLKPARGQYYEIPRFVSIGQFVKSPNNPFNFRSQFWIRLLKVEVD